MRQIIIAAAIAAGFGLATTSPTLSAPLNGSPSALNDAARAGSPVEAARWVRHCRHWRHSRRTCWRRWRRG